jgi:VCBS repeat-containing protein
VAAPGLLANDSDANGDPLTASLDSPASSGDVTLSSDGSFEYLPDPGFTGTDSFTYTANDGALDSNVATVTITVNPIAVNNPPVANGDTASTLEDTALTVDVLANDSDADDDALTVSTVSQGAYAYGAVTNNGSDVTYTPDPGFTGTDSFTYTASDGAADSNVATVTITVNPAPANDPPVANDDFANTTKNTAVTINVVDNDTDPDGSIDPATVVVSQTSKGTAASNGNGTVTFTPKKNLRRGTGTFTYTVNDNEGATSNTATVTVVVVR